MFIGTCCIEIVFYNRKSFMNQMLLLYNKTKIINKFGKTTRVKKSHTIFINPEIIFTYNIFKSSNKFLFHPNLKIFDSLIWLTWVGFIYSKDFIKIKNHGI